MDTLIFQDLYRSCRNWHQLLRAVAEVSQGRFPPPLSMSCPDVPGKLSNFEDITIIEIKMQTFELNVL